jgi:hypothetical protein
MRTAGPGRYVSGELGCWRASAKRSRATVLVGPCAKALELRSFFTCSHSRLRSESSCAGGRAAPGAKRGLDIVRSDVGMCEHPDSVADQRDEHTLGG